MSGTRCTSRKLCCDLTILHTLTAHVLAYMLRFNSNLLCIMFTMCFHIPESRSFQFIHVHASCLIWLSRMFWFSNKLRLRRKESPKFVISDQLCMQVGRPAFHRRIRMLRTTRWLLLLTNAGAHECCWYCSRMLLVLHLMNAAVLHVTNAAAAIAAIGKIAGVAAVIVILVSS